MSIYDQGHADVVIITVGKSTVHVELPMNVSIVPFSEMCNEVMPPNNTYQTMPFNVHVQ